MLSSSDESIVGQRRDHQDSSHGWLALCIACALLFMCFGPGGSSQTVSVTLVGILFLNGLSLPRSPGKDNCSKNGFDCGAQVTRYLSKSMDRMRGTKMCACGGHAENDYSVSCPYRPDFWIDL
mmetsp:Transcript_68813/g.109176  ORF Transcript_68813/g.109176 Transcript_68813/m.109176 type:complete len:123 (+) Transcript_68813:82-450(+)